MFFKPLSGHGSKAVYRGDKLTKGVWADIVKGGFVAQTFVPPGERIIELDGQRVSRKVDVRLYTYEARPLLVAARVYQGQATNLRTPGGGFAPVLIV
jgi:S1-C subfamily serine protease